MLLLLNQLRLRRRRQVSVRYLRRILELMPGSVVHVDPLRLLVYHPHPNRPGNTPAKPVLQAPRDIYAM